MSNRFLPCDRIPPVIPPKYARIARARKQALEAAGWIARNRWDSRGPVNRHHGTWWVDSIPCHCFFDHPTHWYHRATGRKLYVSEPYANDARHWRWPDAHILSHAEEWAQKHGFLVAIREPLSVYYPGATKAVIFHRGFDLDDRVESLDSTGELERAAHA